jgi:hypothetical protein
VACARGCCAHRQEGLERLGMQQATRHGKRRQVAAIPAGQLQSVQVGEPRISRV